MWSIVFSHEAEEWMKSLGARDFAAILAPLDQLEVKGPALGRPAVDRIKGSRHHNMKELRSVGGHLRALFAFDPERQAIVLLGGDKTDDWSGLVRAERPGRRRPLRRLFHLPQGAER